MAQAPSAPLNKSIVALFDLREWGKPQARRADENDETLIEPE
jgi:hypothetical protein